VAAFVGAFVLLDALMVLPSKLTPMEASPYFPLELDVFVLIGLTALGARTVWRRAVRRTCAAVFGLLFAYECYDGLVYTLTGRNGLFAEDARHLLDAAHLIADLPVRWGLGLLAAGGVAVGIGLLVPRLFRTIDRTARHPHNRRLLGGLSAVVVPLAVLVPLVMGTTKTHTAYDDNTWDVAAKVVENVQASVRIHQRLGRLRAMPVDSTYHRYRPVRLAERPNIYLLMIESYGGVLQAHAALEGPYRHLMGEMETALAAEGFQAASARSAAPVYGGRSWLAIASALLGTSVDSQLLYEQFRARQATTPHLVDFLEARDYHTTTLQPGTHPRWGLSLTNLYGFDRTLYRDDLQYQGPPYGWGRVPDQYSLGYAHEQVLQHASPPQFFFFETVAPHAPWSDAPPPLVADWRRLNDPATHRQKDPPPDASARRASPLPATSEAPRTLADAYFQQIVYDWRVLRNFVLEAVPKNSLVLIMGDHQPPLLSGGSPGSQAERFAVPLHVISRDTALVERVQEHGFVRGLQPPTGGAPALQHAGLYSLLVRLLADGCSDAARANSAATPCPPLKPDGISPAGLVQ
jgi:hypothetical protein